MIGVLLLAQVIVASSATRPVLVFDAASGAPVTLAVVESGVSRAITNGAGVAQLAVTRDDSIRIRRVGYRPLAVLLGQHAEPPVRDTLRVALKPVAVSLAAVVTRAPGGSGELGRSSTMRTIDAAREAGVVSITDLLSTLPFVAVRSARGEATLSIRGGRAEQVAVTLDGLSLTDPATGRADASDIPLAALATVRARPGTDGTSGIGAVSGSVALTSGEGTLVSMRSAAYGARELEAALSIAPGEARVRLGGSWHEARNDFPFVNTDGATGRDSLEQRANNDDARLALFATAAWPMARLTVLATHTERGLVGPMNVRIYDADRGRTDRLFVRGVMSFGNWTTAIGVRTQMLAYHSAPAPALDFRAETVAPDFDISGDVESLVVRAGAGLETGRATNIALPTRSRAFVSAEREWSWHELRAVAGVRVDAIERGGTQPSATLGVEWTARVTPFLRVSQAFRAPTLYDLYFASPERLTTRALDPERVEFDAEAGVRARVGDVEVSTAAFARDVRDAIIWFPGNFTWSPSNVGRERVRGAEGQASIAGRWYTASLWGTIMSSTLDAGGLTLQTPYVPEVSGGASVSLRAGSIGLTTTTHGLGRRAFTAAPASSSAELPAVLLTDVAVHWHATVAQSSLLLTAAVTNLGDARWESVRRYPAVGRSWSLALTLVP